MGALTENWNIYGFFTICLSSAVSRVSSAALKPPPKNMEKSHHSTKAIMILLIIAAILVAVRPALDQLDGGHVGVASHYHTIKLGGFLYFFAWFCSGMWLYSNSLFTSFGEQYAANNEQSNCGSWSILHLTPRPIRYLGLRCDPSRNGS